MDNFEQLVAPYVDKTVDPETRLPIYTLKTQPRIITINRLDPKTHNYDPATAPLSKGEARRLLVKTPDGMFTRKEACEKYGIDATSLIARCRGHVKKYKDTWSFFDPLNP